MMARPAQLTSSALLLGLLLAEPALAGTTVDLAADATRPAPNDLVKAILYAEASGTTPGEPARRVNADMAEAIKSSKSAAGVTVRTGNSSTYPIYGKGRAVESWRMRSELLVESRDAEAMADLIGRLQARLALASVVQVPAEATRKAAEAEATRDALKAFQARAAVIADALGKPYRIKHLNVGQSGGIPPMPILRSKMALAAEAAPLPLEAGESAITVSVNGQIELAD